MLLTQEREGLKLINNTARCYGDSYLTDFINEHLDKDEDISLESLLMLKQIELLSSISGELEGINYSIND